MRKGYDIISIDRIFTAHKMDSRNEELLLKKISYKKLWKMLIDKDLNKQTLAQTANISASTLTKMSKGESVNIDMLVKICNALDCEIHDIIELVP